MRAGQAATISVLTATVAVSTRAVALSTPKDAGGGDKATLRADKRALRKAVSVDLSGLSKVLLRASVRVCASHGLEALTYHPIISCALRVLRSPSRDKLPQSFGT